MTSQRFPDDIASTVQQRQTLAIVIIGVSGCGKTTLGRLLAGALACTFIEGDDLHTQASVDKMSAGTALSDDDRWPWLEKVAATIRLLIGGGCVISCSALKRSYRDFIRAHSQVPIVFVHPEVDRDTLLRRLKSRRGHYMPPSLLDSQIATFERPELDEHVIVADGTQTPDGLLSEILNCLSAQDGLLSQPATQSSTRNHKKALRI